MVKKGRVAGVGCATKSGSTFTERARIVVGADGKHSAVARMVHAVEYNQHPPRSCFYYAFWEGLPCNGYEVYWP